MSKCFGTTLRALRAEQRVRQLALALACDCPDATYLSRLERCHRRNPSTRFIARILRGFAELERPLSPAQRERLFESAAVADDIHACEHS